MKRAMLFLKLLVIGGLAAVILIALWLVDGVISSRQQYRYDAVKSIAAGYASEQRITGPFPARPYRTTTPVECLTDTGAKKIKLHPEDNTYSSERSSSQEALRSKAVMIEIDCVSARGFDSAREPEVDCDNHGFGA
jgi:inner membrane protein involved in colicin E2 resistance